MQVNRYDRFFVILAGNATISFPDSKTVLRVSAAELYVAADTADVSAHGHTTTVSRGARILQLPLLGGVVPAHSAVSGACS